MSHSGNKSDEANKTYFESFWYKLYKYTILVQLPIEKCPLTDSISHVLHQKLKDAVASVDPFSGKHYSKSHDTLTCVHTYWLTSTPRIMRLVVPASIANMPFGA